MNGKTVFEKDIVLFIQERRKETVIPSSTFIKGHTSNGTVPVSFSILKYRSPSLKVPDLYCLKYTTNKWFT